MGDKTIAAAEARKLLLREYHGVLSTLSIDAPGYPFGSVVPYCLDRRGCPVLLISRIAQHTKNIQANPKVSLIVTQGEIDDIQSAARLTCLSDASRIREEDEDTPARYYRYFPNSQNYHKVHDFDFYRLELARARYIGGFGDIHWIDPAALLQPNPFTEEEERGMVRHMNEDHVEAMVHYCRIAQPWRVWIQKAFIYAWARALSGLSLNPRSARGSRSAKLWWLWRAATDRQVIGAKFDLDPTEARALIALAEEARAKDFLTPKAIH